MQRYNPKDIEPKWQAKWEADKIYQATEDPSKEKRYVTPMLPYPSGSGLHVGHVRVYSISDTVARFKRQQGYNVLSAMGWDAFGLPAENYAIKTGTSPRITTETNIKTFKNQLMRLGTSFDWSREINTSHPDYYRWTQWIFLQLYKYGLAYQAESAQWWCNECRTVLANEQVINGCCWRHEDLPVVKKHLKQWFFKITEYADRLLENTDALDWPESIKSQQKNWIGRSEGMLFTAPVKDTDLTIQTFSAHFEAFNADTFVVIAPDHPFLPELLKGQDNADEILAQAQEITRKRDALGQKGDEMMEGVFTGRYIVDPVGNGDLPIWIASFALADYGTGIVKCSAHDDRDFAFAKKYKINLKPVLFPADKTEAEKVRNLEYCYNDMKHGILVEPAEFNGKVAGENRQNIIDYLVKQKLAEPKVSYKIHDWLISRQRYWGAPIPIIHCQKDGAVPVPLDQLPVVLPEIENFAPTGEATSVLAAADDWVNVECPKCGGPAKRETDTMDGYACSSWYILRYTDAQNDKQAWDPAKANYWMPLDYYFGGDHAVSHLLYFRFWSYIFADHGLIDESKREPVKKLVYNGYINAEDGSKMSKSKGNVIDPLEVIDSGYGADALRLLEMFIAPYNQNASWSTGGLGGTHRFLQRIWTLVEEFNETDGGIAESIELQRAVHKAIKKVTHDLEEMGFNTAIAAMMELVNELYHIKVEDKFASTEWQWALETLLQLLAPFAPHISEELWEQLGQDESIHASKWPVYDEKFLVQDKVTIVIQVNGKLRGEVEIETDTEEAKVVEAAKTNQKVAGYLKDQAIRKTIFVPNKLVNFVI